MKPCNTAAPAPTGSGCDTPGNFGMITPEVKVRHKRGDVREDGKVFWCYHRGEELWVSKEQFTHKKQIARNSRLKQAVIDPERGRESRRKWREKNREKVLASNKKWRDKNPDKARAIAKKWREKNKDKAREYSKKWRKNNPEKAREAEKNWRERNLEKDRAKAREWREKNIERARENGRKWQKSNTKRASENRRVWAKKRRSTDTLFALAGNLRSRMQEVFQRKCGSKPYRFEKILGTTVSIAKAYLEAQFKPGMSWENRKSWHIDHIIPLASAKTTEELVSLCHYTNLQPLWASDNIRKGSKMPNQLNKKNS